MTNTTYILAGGNDRLSSDYGKRLSDEIARYTVNPKILSCFYSQPEKTWAEKAEDWSGWFKENFQWPFTYDYTKSDTFLDQVKDSDVIYFHGGDTKLLLSRLPNGEVLKDLFENKVVIGSSAGSNMLARYYWSSTKGEFGEGKAVLDMAVMVHYGAELVGDKKRTSEEWNNQEVEFAAMITTPITRLPEGQFVVVEDK